MVRLGSLSSYAAAVGGTAAAVAVAAAGLVGRAAAQLPTCPPPGFDSLRGFNVTKYADLDYGWYAQEQMEITYLPLEWNYCVKTTYNQLQQDLVAVFNYARIGSVDGEVAGAELRAYIADVNDPSKLAVGPIGLPTDFYGPYWVLAAGPDNTERYDWALVSGGPPTIPTPNGCRTRENFTNASGLFILFRVPFPPTSEVDRVRALAEELGFDISVLNPIEHRGCNYTMPA